MDDMMPWLLSCFFRRVSQLSGIGVVVVVVVVSFLTATTAALVVSSAPGLLVLPEDIL